MIYIPSVRKVTREKGRYLKVLQLKKKNKKPKNNLQVRKAIFILHFDVFLKIGKCGAQYYPSKDVHILTPGTREGYPTWKRFFADVIGYQ